MTKTMCVTARSTADDAGFDRFLEGLVPFPPDYVQVRDHSATDRRALALTVRAVERLPGSRVLANRRFDVALAAGAAGVVLPEAGLPVAPVRREAPRGFVIGKSTHSAEAARRAADDGADVVLLGPIFPTPGKSPIGPDVLEALAPGWPESAELFLIGGIDAATAGALAPFRGRFHGIAAIRWFEDAPDPAASVRAAASA